ncbi:sensor domain-containing diguanylate cyclase [Pontibacillus litoralis]|uniref:DeoR family transcriptional regulator n=1 Tax=Pontibacillus litoralis JSM 072002 TaxID=1385512 RepID=A0A0A5GDE2_9BACI|nr:sensor domain-containing diguanylate cyclase [Pontibacillus litoralis]KGX89135.1 DeoR family transcriptional regulator [Pontibacillus litoralis JSM 072002]
MAINQFQLSKLNEWKSRLFDLFFLNEDMSYQAMLDASLQQVKVITEAPYVHFYLFNEANDQLDLACEQISQHPSIVSVFKDEEIIKSILNGQFIHIPCDAYLHIGVPVMTDKVYVGLLLVTYDHDKEYKDDLHFLLQIGETVAKYYVKLRVYYNTVKEEKRHKLLLNVTEKFHSSMNTDDILAEIISTLRTLYSDWDYYLLLSHDYSSARDLPIELLEYDHKDNATARTQAFLTGNYQLEDCADVNRSCFYAPLKGKQGVYGVLQIITPYKQTFPNKDKELITMLANTAGNALENARLYEQSKKFISDLQLINETSHKLNSSLRLTETVMYMAAQIKQSFGAEEVGFIFYENNMREQFDILEGSSMYFHSDEAHNLMKEVSLELNNKQDAVFSGDIIKKYGDRKYQYQSMMAIPMIQRGLLKGVVIVLHSLPYYYTFDAFKLMQSLVHHSTLAFSNSILREELEQLVSSDYLTKLASRKFLDDMIHKHIEQGDKASLLLVDIDDFKKVNDVYGHQVGDRILVQVANIMKKFIGDKGVVARWGGEEIAVFIPSSSIKKTYKIAETIVKMVREQTTPAVTVSCGVSIINPAKHYEEDFFVRADKALYKAKNAGKDTVCLEENCFCE